jgi:tetratricopeptide (TPR) repeat protein
MDSFYEDLQAGAYYRMEENFSQALVHFNRAVEKQPNNFEAYLERGVNYHLRNQVFFALHDFRYALYHCTDSYACQNESKKAQYFIHLLQGLIYETNSHWEKAVTEYERALHCDKQGFYAYFSIGYAYGSLSLANGQGDNTQLYKQAIRYFLKALALIDSVPHHQKYYSFYQSVIHTNIAWMQKRLEQSTEALFYYQKAIDANPRHVRAYFSRAILHRGMNQRELALKDYSSCIRIFEDQYKTLVTSGNVQSVNIVKKRMASILEDRVVSTRSTLCLLDFIVLVHRYGEWVPRSTKSS